MVPGEPDPIRSIRIRIERGGLIGAIGSRPATFGSRFSLTHLETFGAPSAPDDGGPPAPLSLKAQAQVTANRSQPIGSD